MSSTDLVKYDSRKWIALMEPAVELAKHVCDTEFVPRGMRGKPAAIVAAIMYGDEVGLGPMQALAKIAVIEGRPSLSSEAQRALILAAGHEIWVVESSNTKVTIAGRRRGGEQTSTITWTLDDAKRANLAGKQNWRTYPRQMLMARATAELARLIFADAVGGLLATEELEDSGEESGAPAEASTTKRKRKVLGQPETSNRTSPEGEIIDRPELPPLPEVDSNGSGEVGTPALPPLDESGAEPLAALAASPRTPSASAPVESGASPSPPAPVGADHGGGASELKPTKRQGDKLNKMVVDFRKLGVITTEQMWSALASSRNVDVEMMIQLLHGRDSEGVLHWGPLIPTITRAEASGLIDRLERFEANLPKAAA